MKKNVLIFAIMTLIIAAFLAFFLITTTEHAYATHCYPNTCSMNRSPAHLIHVWEQPVCGYCGGAASTITYSYSYPASAGTTQCSMTLTHPIINCCYDYNYIGVAWVPEPPLDTVTPKRDISLPQLIMSMSAWRSIRHLTLCSPQQVATRTPLINKHRTVSQRKTTQHRKTRIQEISGYMAGIHGIVEIRSHRPNYLKI